MTKVILSPDERSMLDLIRKDVEHIETFTRSLKHSTEDKTPTGIALRSLINPEQEAISANCTMIIVSLSDIKRYLDTIERHTI